MTEIDKNVLQDIEQNKKVEVVVKRDNSAHAGELDLVRVFSNMGKTFFPATIKANPAAPAPAKCQSTNKPD